MKHLSVRYITYLLTKCPKLAVAISLKIQISFLKLSSVLRVEGKCEIMMAILAFGGIILVVSAGLFGAYALGFYDGVKDGKRLAADRAQ
jgi:hypothetical protein